MTKQEAQDAVKKYGSKSAAARALGIPRANLYSRLEGRPEGYPKRTLEGLAAARATAGDTPVRTLAEFRAQFDKDFIVPRKIKFALKALGASGWDYEQQFAKRAGVSLCDLANYREQFAEHLVVLKRDGKRAWAGTPRMASEMRAMVS